MGSEVNIYYDEEGDYLEVAMGDISNSYFENLGNGTFQIIDKKTKKIMGFAVFSFKNRTKSLEMLKLSLPFKLEFA
jgi:hypothetical protein